MRPGHALKPAQEEVVEPPIGLFRLNRYHLDAGGTGFSAVVSHGEIVRKQCNALMRKADAAILPFAHQSCAGGCRYAVPRVFQLVA